jgi:uncharacterized protein
MTSAFDPTSLRVKAFAQANASLEGSVPVKHFERLYADCVGEVGAPVQWAAQGDTQKKAGASDEIWLHLQAQAQAPLICQRCLKPVLVELLVDRDFRFVPDEATAMAEDDEAEEDLLVLSSEFDLLALVEDELLMDLPLVPMHEACESEYVPTSGDLDTSGVAEKPNPFAVLAALKTKEGD